MAHSNRQRTHWQLTRTNRISALVRDRQVRRRQKAAVNTISTAYKQAKKRQGDKATVTALRALNEHHVALDVQKQIMHHVKTYMGGKMPPLRDSASMATSEYMRANPSARAHRSGLRTQVATAQMEKMQL